MNKYTFDEIQIGMEEMFSVKISPKDMETFCQLTGDNNPIHCTQQYAMQHGFGDRIVYGMLTASFFSTLAGIYLPGEKSLIQNLDINFIKPVYINDVLTIKGKVIEKNELFKVIKMKISITDSNFDKVVRGKMQIGVLE